MACEMLNSGLPEKVDDSETIVRFLTQSNHFSREKNAVKPSAFMPANDPVETSVFRIDATEGVIQAAFASSGIGHGRLYGAAHLVVSEIRGIGLDVVSSEPPNRHAAIVQWPNNLQDADEEKARRKDLANKLASKAALTLITT